jgi:hypothetical protein
MYFRLYLFYKSYNPPRIRGLTCAAYIGIYFRQHLFHKSCNSPRIRDLICAAYIGIYFRQHLIKESYNPPRIRGLTCAAYIGVYFGQHTFNESYNPRYNPRAYGTLVARPISPSIVDNVFLMTSVSLVYPGIPPQRISNRVRQLLPHLSMILVIRLDVAHSSSSISLVRRLHRPYIRRFPRVYALHTPPFLSILA